MSNAKVLIRTYDRGISRPDSTRHSKPQQRPKPISHVIDSRLNRNTSITTKSTPKRFVFLLAHCYSSASEVGGLEQPVVERVDATGCSSDLPSSFLMIARPAVLNGRSQDGSSSDEIASERVWKLQAPDILHELCKPTVVIVSSVHVSPHRYTPHCQPTQLTWRAF